MLKIKSGVWWELCKLKEADQKLLVPLSKSKTYSSVVLVPSTLLKWLICYIYHYPISSVCLTRSDPTQPLRTVKQVFLKQMQRQRKHRNTECYLCLPRQTNPTTQRLLKGNWRQPLSVFLAELIPPWALFSTINLLPVLYSQTPWEHWKHFCW